MAGNDYPGERRAAVVPGKDRHEDKLARGEMKPPAELDAKAKKLFREYADEMNRSGVLRRVDLPVLAEFCQAVADVARYRKKIREWGGEVKVGPNGGEQHCPWNGYLKDARRRVAVGEKALGLSPKARNNLRFPSGAGAITPEEDEQMDLFMKGQLWNRPDEPPQQTGS